MKNYIAIVLLGLLNFFAACSKNADNSEPISIRVKNETSLNFKTVIVNNKSFENVKAPATTSYQRFDKAVALPSALLVTNDNDTLQIGLYYIDPPVSYLKSGKYTLKIFDDPTAYYGYNCEYIKD